MSGDSSAATSRAIRRRPLYRSDRAPHRRPDSVSRRRGPARLAGRCTAHRGSADSGSISTAASATAGDAPRLGRFRR